MTIPVVTFFSSTGSSGKSSLVYHISHMLAELGKKVLVLDLDPQSNLTSTYLGDDVLEELWGIDDQGSQTILQVMKLFIGVSYPYPPRIHLINQNLFFIPGDIKLGGLEDELSTSWWETLKRPNRSRRAFRALTAFWQFTQNAAIHINADIVLSDVGPNLDSINRSALIGTDYIVSPLGIDLLSLQGLRILGPTLDKWRTGWEKRAEGWESPYLELPKGKMEPIGYILQQSPVRLGRPIRADSRWANQLPEAYHDSILGNARSSEEAAEDPYRLGVVKHYRSLVPMAVEARKPIYKLTPADGAIGNHAVAVGDAYTNFIQIAIRILKQVDKRTADPAN